MGSPAFSERSEATPTIGGPELDREDIAEFTIEVGVSRLVPLEHADHDVAQYREAQGDDPQRHRLAGTIAWP